MVYGNSGVESFEYFNRSASVEYMGNLYSFDEDDFMEIISPSNYWHGVITSYSIHYTKLYECNPPKSLERLLTVSILVLALQ